MEDLVELYLFKNKKCPLPELGVLELIETSAIASLAERKIHAPIPAIMFVESTMSADDFIEFIAHHKSISKDDAAVLLKQYSRRLQNMDAFGEAKLPNAGKFHVNAGGNIIFKATDIQRTFLPDVNAERVIHPAVSHSMRVGDKETTSAAMAAYYTDAASAGKDKWWIWAIVLAIITAGVIMLYFDAESRTSTFGNQQKIQVKASTITYQLAE